MFRKEWGFDSLHGHHIDIHGSSLLAKHGFKGAAFCAIIRYRLLVSGANVGTIVGILRGLAKGDANMPL